MIPGYLDSPLVRPVSYSVSAYVAGGSGSSGGVEPSPADPAPAFSVNWKAAAALALPFVFFLVVR